MGNSARTRPGSDVAAGLAQLRGYSVAGFRTDGVAGLTVTAYLIPQCLAYASLAGVDPVIGLWVAVVAMVAYALLGTSRLLSVGPESTTAIMVATAVGPLAAGDPARYAALCAGLALLIGVIAVAAFVLRLGFLADLLSQPILIGYMAGVALIMIGSQLGKVTGVTITADSTIAQMVELSSKAGEVVPAAVALGLGVTVFLLVLRRVAPLAPGALIAVVVTAVLVEVLGLQAHGIKVVGPVPGGLPGVRLPGIGVSDAIGLAGSAAAIAFVAYTDVALTGRAFAARTGDPIDANRELLALGGASLASGLIGGIPLSASSSRTAILATMRAHSQAAGLVSAAAVTVVVLAVPGLISYIPLATLGGIVVYAGIYLIDVGGLRRLARFRMSELGLAIAALAGVLIVGVLGGILLAIGLSVADLFVRIARPPASVLGRVPNLEGLHNVEDYPNAEQIPGLLVFRYDALLCFANAEDFRTRALRAVDEHDGEVEWFLLNAEAIVELDMTSADALGELVDELADRRIVFAMARVKQDLREQLDRAGLLRRIDEAHIYPTLPVAVQAFEGRAARGEG